VGGEGPKREVEETGQRGRPGWREAGVGTGVAAAREGWIGAAHDQREA
jgi:hypothetical protein